MSFELCFRARETAAEDRCPVEGRRPLPSWADLAPACVSLPASVHVDTIGQKVQIDDLNAGTWTFGYDDAGNLAWHEDPRGNRFAFGYDDGNRLIWEDCMSGPTCGPEIEVRYFYDSPATWENGEGFFPAGIVDHDGIELPQTHVLGRLAWVQDRARRTYTSYDARGEVVAQAKNLHGIAMVPDENAPEVLKQVPVGDAEIFYVSTRELDDVGRVRRETLVDGTELDYTYDRRGLLATLSGVYQNRALTFVQSVDYDLQGRRIAAAQGGGIRETKTYNQVGRTLTTRRVLVDEYETPIAEVLHLAYTYDRLGLLTSQTDLRAEGLRFTESSAPTVKTYTYDGQGQLLTSEERLVSDNTLIRRMEYDYDVLGNIVEKHTTRCVETTYPCTEQDDPTDEYYTHWFGTATYNGDQLISADGGDGNSLVATYDVAGNMETLAVTRGGQPYLTHTYTWDEQNRLASAASVVSSIVSAGLNVTAVAGYAYDNGGARIAALRAGNSSGMEFEETLYIDPSFEIRNGEHTTYIHDSKGRLARLLPIDDNIISKITWLHADHLGSTSVVTSDDGTFIEETKYLPYGAVQSTYRPSLGLPYEPYGFTGKEPEPDFGILYFGARYYNPHLARWISPDPLFLHVTSETAEKSQNGYCYTSNDPVNRVDPDGMWPEWVDDAVDSVSELGEQAVEAGKIIWKNPASAYRWGRDVVVPEVKKIATDKRTLTVIATKSLPVAILVNIKDFKDAVEEGRIRDAAMIAIGIHRPVSGIGLAFRGWRRSSRSSTASNPKEAPISEKTGTTNEICRKRKNHSSSGTTSDAAGEVVGRGWRLGDDVYAPTARGNAPSWSTVRSRFWKNEAAAEGAVQRYGAENIERMQRGRAPQRFNPRKGGMESMELSHEPIPAREGGRDFIPRWPADHARVDPYRRPGY